MSTVKAEYFNTTHQTGSNVLRYRRSAQTQAHVILEYFEKYPGECFTPSEISDRLFFNRVPITSVRRAMTTLTDDNKLRKTSTQKDGPYGRPEYAWQLASTQLQLL